MHNSKTPCNFAQRCNVAWRFFLLWRIKNQLSYEPNVRPKPKSSLESYDSINSLKVHSSPFFTLLPHILLSFFPDLDRTPLSKPNEILTAIASKNA